MTQQASIYLSKACLALALGSCFTPASFDVRAEERFAPVPKAACGPQDRTESVQGQTTLAERFSPAPAKAYNCNLELVGQFEGEGAAVAVEAFDVCAYYTTTSHARMKNPGVAVLDVTDARKPKAVGYLTSPAMLGAFESLEVHAERKLLLGSAPPSKLDIYDLSGDCRKPMLKSSVSLPGLVSHSGRFTTDGLTYYGAKWPTTPDDPPASGVFALDVADPARPKPLVTWIPRQSNWNTHGVVVSKDGKRAYVALKRMADDQEKSAEPNGLAILDSSAVQARTPNPQLRLISTHFWEDSHASEGFLPATIRGRPYVILADNLGAIGMKSPPPATACDSGRPGHGYARIIDIGDEKNPRTVSRLILEVSDPANCRKVMHDPNLYGAYGAFGCNVDNHDDAKLLACAYFEGGLRVFDIRDPQRPREIGYYKPRARRGEDRPGSLFNGAKDRTVDSVLSIRPQFRRNGQEIWIVSVDNGFQVLRFSERFKTANKDLFR